MKYHLKQASKQARYIPSNTYRCHTPIVQSEAERLAIAYRAERV